MDVKNYFLQFHVGYDHLSVAFSNAAITNAAVTDFLMHHIIPQSPQFEFSSAA